MRTTFIRSMTFLSTVCTLGGTTVAQGVETDLAIAVVGAGASGLTTAHTLKEQGYKHVNPHRPNTSQ